MNEQTEHEAEIEEGDNGQFDVLVDGGLMFSKQASGRFPDHGEVRDLISARQT